MADPNQGYAFGAPVRMLGEPFANAAAVTPDDNNDLPNGATRALYVGVAGDITVNMLGSGAPVLFKAAPVGILNVRVTRVKATGTAATNLLALW
jgi:hypothetical protein